MEQQPEHYESERRDELGEGHRLDGGYEVPDTVPALMKSGALTWDVPPQIETNVEAINETLPFCIDNSVLQEEESEWGGLVLAFIPDELGSDHSRIDEILPPRVATFSYCGEASLMKRLAWSFWPARDGDEITDEHGEPVVMGDLEALTLEFAGGYGALYACVDIDKPPAIDPLTDQDVRSLVNGSQALLDGGEEKLIELIEHLLEQTDKAPEWVMASVDYLLRNHGVEVIWNPRYGSEPLFTYSNAGDTYTTTIVFCHERDEYFVTSWGSLYEEWCQRNCYDAELEQS